VRPSRAQQARALEPGLGYSAPFLLRMLLRPRRAHSANYYPLGVEFPNLARLMKRGSAQFRLRLCLTC